MTIKKFCIFSLLIVIANIASAQNFKSAIGVQAGIFNGLNVVWKPSYNWALEADINSHYKFTGGQISCLAGRHQQIYDSKWDVFVGMGFGGAYWDGDTLIPINKTVHKKYQMALFNFSVALEYTFPSVPLNAGIEIRPTIYSPLTDDNAPSFWVTGFQFTLRYVIKRS